MLSTFSGCHCYCSCMKAVAILFARFALALGFLSAVADRFALWGQAGTPSIAWGNWGNFLEYTSELSFGSSGILLDFFAITATVLEIFLAVLLITGYKLRFAALASGILLAIFGLSMTFNTGIKFAFDYSVFTATACCALLYFLAEEKQHSNEHASI